jgi:hypothetical protein
MADGFLVIDGTPVLSIDGLSSAQSAAVEAATRLLPMRAWHDGLVRNIAANLPGTPPWANSDVMAAVEAALADLGVTTPVLSGPEQQFAAAMLSGTSTVAAAA